MKAKRLLASFNSVNSKLYNEFVDNLYSEPKIAWYPSAGNDFNALKFFSYAFINEKTEFEVELVLPDIFIYTDYYLFDESDFLNIGNKYIDRYNNTVITEEVEFIGKIDIPLHPEIVERPKGNPNLTNKIYYLKMLVQSKDYGEVRFPVIYAFVENESFCFSELVQKEVDITHIVHVRYGGGLGGGGMASGVWLLKALKSLNCKVFITDGHLDIQEGDRYIEDLYNLVDIELPNLIPIRTIFEENWRNHGDITWNLIE